MNRRWVNKITGTNIVSPLKNWLYTNSVRNLVFALLLFAYWGNEARAQANGIQFLDSLIQAWIDVNTSASVVLGSESSWDWWLLGVYENAQWNPANNTEVTITTTSWQVFHLFADGSWDGNFYFVVWGETVSVRWSSMLGSENCPEKYPDFISLANTTTGATAEWELCVWSTVLSLDFDDAYATQLEKGSDRFHLFFHAYNLRNTWKIHVRASSTPFNAETDDARTFWHTLYTIAGPESWNAPEFTFNKVVHFDMDALRVVDGDNDWRVYLTFVEEEWVVWDNAGTFNVYEKLDVLSYDFDFGSPTVSPNPISQREGIQYTVPSAFKDWCIIELINNSWQVKHTWEHQKWWGGNLSITNHVPGWVYFMKFISPFWKVEIVKVVVMW